MLVLLSVKSAQMEEAVNALDRDQLDILMKYIYRGFETPAEGSSGHLLAWHEKVHAVAGVGCIVRVLTDKKRVWSNHFLLPLYLLIIQHYNTCFVFQHFVASPDEMVIEKRCIWRALTREARVCNTYKMNRWINILAFGWPKGGERRKETTTRPCVGFGRNRDETKS